MIQIGQLLTWFLAQQDSIVAGIVSSLIVLSLQVLVTTFALLIHDLITKRIHLKRLWGFKSPRKIYIVSGNVENLTDGQAPEMVFLAAPDAAAVSIVHNTLETLYPKADIIHTHSSIFSGDAFRENIVAVGGPINNSCTRTLLHEFGDNVRFEEMDLVVPAGRYKLERPAEGENVGTDYGLVITAPNPFNPENRCVLLAGCDTNGVFASAKMFEIGRVSRRLLRFARRELKFKPIRSQRQYVVIKTRAFGASSGEPVPVTAGSLR